MSGFSPRYIIIALMEIDVVSAPAPLGEKDVRYLVLTAYKAIERIFELKKGPYYTHNAVWKSRTISRSMFCEVGSTVGFALVKWASMSFRPTPFLPVMRSQTRSAENRMRLSTGGFNLRIRFWTNLLSGCLNIAVCVGISPRRTIQFCDTVDVLSDATNVASLAQVTYRLTTNKFGDEIECNSVSSF